MLGTGYQQEVALDRLYEDPGPALVDVAVNPDEPPLPGKLKG